MCHKQGMVGFAKRKTRPRSTTNSTVGNYKKYFSLPNSFPCWFPTQDQQNSWPRVATKKCQKGDLYSWRINKNTKLYFSLDYLQQTCSYFHLSIQCVRINLQIQKKNIDVLKVGVKDKCVREQGAEEDTWVPRQTGNVVVRKTTIPRSLMICTPHQILTFRRLMSTIVDVPHR